MKTPREEQWLRIEELAEQLKLLPPEQVTPHLAQLAAAGESPTVLTMLGSWLSLPPPSAPLGVGNVVGGHYELKERIGKGGMGTVWRAKQEMIGRNVALKMIHPALVSPSFRARFVSEIQLLGQLNHPGIVKIFDAGLHDIPGFPPIPFFVMELVQGVPLDQWAAARHGNYFALLLVMTAVCDAVRSAHERRIIHRDLKPSNILVAQDGHPVVLDFGIARLAGAAGEEEGLFSGTPQYAAPEQHLGRDHDFRSGESVDVYALGAILFQILTGRKLFLFPKGAALSEMRRIVLESRLPRLSEVAPDCPPFLDEIVARALRRDPADRFYSMAALGRALTRAAALLSRSEAPPPPWSPSPGAVVPGTDWRLKEKIGEGGAGQVWLGFHDQLGERRVFKFCDTEDKARTLKRELTLFRLLKERVGRNPHFVQLHEVSLDEPPWYLMMDYTDARDLDSWSAAQPEGPAGITEEVRLEIVAQVADALQAAHEAGILHRDIKPGNILVRRTGEEIHVLIADFGIGQIVANELLTLGTRQGFTRTVADLQRSALSGTMLYMAPEVIEGHPATARSDIYSLGVVLWQLLIGNLSAALDPADWPSRISDPLLREDLTRCLAGSPDKRWPGAGQLAASLRALPLRRAAAARRAAELAARERSAYWRGVARTIVIAVTVVAAIGWLAWTARLQQQEAERARGEIALQQASALPRADFDFERRARGMSLLDTATATVTNRAALRRASAAVVGMADLVRVPSSKPTPMPAPSFAVPPVPRECARTIASDGATVARARDVDGLNGVVELIDAATGRPLAIIKRKQFPWVPIAEPALLRFSPDNRLLAVGGAATSRHVLLCRVPDGTVSSYIFQGSDPVSFAWHPGGRVVVTGCADGTVRVWDTAAAVVAEALVTGPSEVRGSSPSENQFDLPPRLDTPALDTPLHTLRGHRGPVQHLVFWADGRCLASIDGAGYLRVHGGFSREGLPRLPPPERAGGNVAGNSVPSPVLAVEIRLEDVQGITQLAAIEDRIVVHRTNGPIEEFRLLPAELPAETHVASRLTDVAWNSNGLELCAITLTDIHWLRSSPLEVFCTSTGKNPVAVSWHTNGFWVLPKDDKYIERRPIPKAGLWDSEEGTNLALAKAEKGQGSRTLAASPGDGRVAVYHGRRIQFFADRKAAPLESSLTNDGGGGVFRQSLWDQPGRLLAAVFVLEPGRLRLETWETTTDFPPRVRQLSPAALECHRIIPANDGQACIARGRRGIFRFDLTTGRKTNIDTSPGARQDAPLMTSRDGAFLAVVTDRNLIRLLKLPAGTFFADLYSPRQTEVTELAWDWSGRRLASLTSDGYVQVWNLGPWLDWIALHQLNE